MKKRSVPRKATAKKPETAIQKVDLDAQILSNIIIRGDISSLTPAQKIDYYNAFCRYVGLNAITQPFAILQTKKKDKQGNWISQEVLYAKKEATEQLRTLKAISITQLTGEIVGGVIYRVTAVGQNAQGRTDAATGAVSVKGLQGEALANAIMKAESKAKRRLTLSLSGLGMMDESEIETVPGAVVVNTQRPAQEYGDESLAPGDGPSDDEPRKEQRGDLQPERREAPAASAVSVYKQTKIIQIQNLFDTGLASGFLTAEEVSDGKREWGKTKTIEDVNVVYLKYKKLAEDRYLAGESEGKREQGSEGKHE